MKKVFIDAYLLRNLGDDLFLKVLFDRYKDIEWYIATDDKVYYNIFEKYYNVKIIKVSFIHKFLRKLNLFNAYKKIINIKKYDSLLFIGGSIFMEDNFWKKTYNYRKSLIESFKFSNKSIFILGSNFGPYKSQEFYDKYKGLFELCNDVCFRDRYSYDLFSDLKNTRVETDVVFQLNKPTIIKDKKTIGFSLINLENRNELKEFNYLYINSIKDIIKECLSKDYKVFLFSFCKKEGDELAIKNIISSFNDSELKKIEIVRYEDDLEEFLAKFASVEVIVGSRFHSIILSQVFEQGVYPFIYSNKTYNILEDINLNENYIYINKLGKFNIMQVINNIESNKVDKDKLNDLINSSIRQFDIFDRYYKSNFKELN